MKVITQIKALREYLNSIRKNDKSIGFVPTMGALHEGHLTLVRQSVKENLFTVCSIFVNPTQFNDPADLKKYPRTLQKDCEMLEEAGCDLVFAPDTSEVYPSEATISLTFGYLEEILEGKFRPGHFQGVGLVVSKLLHMVQPDRAYFGQKDYQQFLIIQTLVKDLNFPVKLIRVPIIREKDGLAMSSRNMRLSEEERAAAPVFFEALNAAAEVLKRDKNVNGARALAGRLIEEKNGVSLEYFEIAHPDTLKPLSNETVGDEVVLCVAGYVGNIRLIDNLIVNI
ncbi:pantoate--beta-alanine ligase [Roseivirga sp. BDSF3-8]|uniref:pantoate--beta-alanine ligase n=1 Tax=Roseivirga sp. BDSF3-8 TaxID=3241598 RepID=UPI003532509E